MVSYPWMVRGFIPVSYPRFHTGFIPRFHTLYLHLRFHTPVSYPVPAHVVSYVCACVVQHGYITLPYTALRSTTLHYSTLYYIILQYDTLYYIILRITTPS